MVKKRHYIYSAMILTMTLGSSQIMAETIIANRQFASQEDASKTCPQLCESKGMGWEGVWRTPAGQVGNSVCDCGPKTAQPTQAQAQPEKGSQARESVNYILELVEFVPKFDGYLAKILEFKNNAPKDLKGSWGESIPLDNTAQSLNQLITAQTQHQFLPFIIISKTKLPGQQGRPGQKVGAMKLEVVGLSGIKIQDAQVVPLD